MFQNQSQSVTNLHVFGVFGVYFGVVWLVCDGKYQPFCFTARCLIYFFPFPFFERLGQRISQTARDSRKIPTDSQSVIRGTKFPKFVLPFPPFPGGVESTYSQFSPKLFNQCENCLRILIKILEFYQSMRHGKRLLHDLVLNFQVQ